jgi:hypothetical protein
MSRSTAATKTVIARAMACAEDARLKEIYETALRAWLNSRLRLFEGVRSSETTFQFRKRLLQSRLKAANDLYEHSLTCPTCNARANSMFDDDCR